MLHFSGLFLLRACVSDTSTFYLLTCIHHDSFAEDFGFLFFCLNSLMTCEHLSFFNIFMIQVLFVLGGEPVLGVAFGFIVCFELSVAHLCCTAHKKMSFRRFFAQNLRLEAPLPVSFFCTTFRHSATTSATLLISKCTTRRWTLRCSN